MVLGLSAFTTLARQEDPTMTERYGFVKTFLPGASAERVETLITERIEKKLREIPEIKELRSESRSGLSFINVEFEDRVGPELIDVLWSEVRDKVGTLEGELPSGTLTPEVEARGPIATTLALALRWTGPGDPPRPPQSPRGTAGDPPGQPAGHEGNGALRGTRGRASRAIESGPGRRRRPQR